MDKHMKDKLDDWIQKEQPIDEPEEDLDVEYDFYTLENLQRFYKKSKEASAELYPLLLQLAKDINILNTYAEKHLDTIVGGSVEELKTIKNHILTEGLLQMKTDQRRLKKAIDKKKVEAKKCQKI